MSHHLKNRRLKKPAATHNDRHGADRHIISICLERGLTGNLSNEFPRFIFVQHTCLLLATIAEMLIYKGLS